MHDTIKPDVVLFGAGIAGLWAFHQMKSMGYSVLLLENEAIGSGQTIASQGIIHSGLKYAFAGKINKLAKSISAMSDLWIQALDGKGPVDLSKADYSTESQFLLIPGGLMGGLIKLVTEQALGNNVRECAPDKWPEEISQTGFKGRVVYMDEPVLDIPSVLRALAEPYKDCVRKIDMDDVSFDSTPQGIERIVIGDQIIEPNYVIFTAAGSNHEIAKDLRHDRGLKTQKRPLVQGMMKKAPYPLFAHLVGHTDKPVATITTHEAADGSLVWYVGGLPAERNLDAPPQEVYDAIKKGFAKYLPKLDLGLFEWSTYAVDRVEGHSKTQNWLPDTPMIHSVGNSFYCWPTKATFAPMLSDMLLKKMEKPAGGSIDFSFLPPVEFAKTPWDTAIWTKNN